MIVFFLVAIILVLDVAYLGEHMATVAIIREVIAAAAAVVAGVIYVFDFILNLKGSSP